ncbi:MAG TPA: TIGR02117 family protein [Planctomycetota bacterium]|nr:TIGR02117 family protein [Planctomycetota bacterium]
MGKRRWRRIARNVLLVLIGPPALYVLAALGLGFIPVNRDFVAASDGIEVHLLSNGIHVDFLVPVKSSVMDWSEKIPRSDFPGAVEDCTHLLVGWGNRNFYLETPTWADLKASTVARVVFWPSATVMHVEYVHGPPTSNASTRRIRIGHGAYRKLCAFLEASFQHKATGAFKILPGRGYGDADNFYEGVGTYHAFNTCNQWTNRGLKTIGVRTALWSPFPFGILHHLPADSPPGER